MNTKKTIAILMALASAAAFAADAETKVEETAARGRWTVRAGYAWRARANTDFSASTSQSPGGGYQNGSFSGDLGGSQDWTYSGAFDEGRYYDLNYGNTPLYSMGLTRDESIGSGSSEDSGSGFNLSAGYDVWQGTYVDVSIMAMFAGYWKMENSCSGGYRSYNDNYAFNFPTPEMGFGTPVSGVSTAEFRERTYGIGGANPTMNMRTDLYQIGLGPQVTWHAFEGWCTPLSWIDIYGNVQALCNIIKSDFSAGAASTSDTNCRFGVGGNVGLLGNITDWCGIYLQASYEWVDKYDVEVQNCRAENDLSSFLVSAGLQFRF